MTLLLWAIGLLLGSGMAALLVSRKSPILATRLAIGGVVIGCLLGLVPASAALYDWGIGANALSEEWMTELGGSLRLRLDPLSAFFAILILGISALAAVYGGEYMLPRNDAGQSKTANKKLGFAWFFFNVLVASMLLVVLARNGLLFLVAWEIMALASYFLVTYESEREDVCRAGWIYLVATHLGTAFLLIFFVLLGDTETGSLDFGIPLAGDHPARTALFLLAVVGFGTKAGLVPFHVWLPEAHAAAPSHVSALMSAVMIKLGIYGLLRTIYLLGTPEPWWGPTLMIIGLVGGLLGISQALYQRDLKRVLAYSSIENIGLITLGIGIGLWGWSADQMGIAALGFAGAILHIWNHALMKGLMFFAAGGVVHSTGTRDMEKLGGLIKTMPWTATLLIVGAAALAALPPLNAFVSEWLLYLGLLRAGLDFPDSRGLGALLAVGMLATIGGLTAVCFVRLLGIACLGTARSDEARHAHDAGPAMRLPMLILASLCIASGVLPLVLITVFSRVMNQILGADALANLDSTGASVAVLGWVQLAIWAAIGCSAALLWRLVSKSGTAAHGTWDCGFAAPTARMQYTGRSFAEIMAERLLPLPFRPRVSRTGPQGLFPGQSSFQADCSDPVTERGYVWLFQRVGNACMRLWWVQHGTINLYLVYLMVLIFLGLAWMTVRTWVLL
ncbi:MAG TPA: proton-conducting transporter membrane subunit [Gemmataceae bacterium]|nr:proton-conducting transporter membrane subunit [Gemmataceae bacterium]